jgi:prepilin peptidase CpaA
LPDTIAHLIVVGLAVAAAITDWRTGRIPNWLTLPPLMAAPAAHFLFSGVAGLAQSVLAIIVCGLAPYLLFRKNAIGGGDVKLLAALGAVAGIDVGLEGQLFGFAVAAIYAVARLAWERKLGALLRNSAYLLFNTFVPRRRRRAIEPSTLTSVRLGGAILVGTCLAIAVRHPGLWG